MKSIQEICSKDHSPQEIQAWGHRPYREDQKVGSIKVQQMSLEATITAQNFYRKVGFVDAGPETTVEISGTPIRCYPMKMELS